MSGLHEAFDEIVADVPAYGDLDRAIEQAERNRRHRQGVIAGLAAAAAVVAVIIGVLAVTRDDDATRPVGPLPSPTPSVRYESPDPQDHPVGLYDDGGALVLITQDRLDRVGTATVWRRDADRWQNVGKLEHVVPLHLGYDSDGTRFSPGPSAQDVIATGLADNAVGFSHDGGATWTYLSRPSECHERQCYVMPADGYIYIGGTELRTSLIRADFGATDWHVAPLPPSGDPRLGYRGPFALDDGTLVIVEGGDDCESGAASHYRVSRDHGDSWSERRSFADGCIYGPAGNALYGADNGIGQYRSTDLVHWKPVHVDGAFPPDAARPCSHWAEGRPWPIERPVRVGEAAFSLLHLNYRDGQEIRPRRGMTQEGPHDVEHVLIVSRDDCRTWTRALR